MIGFKEFKERYQKVPVKEYPNRVVETVPEPMVSVHVGTYQHADFIHDCMEGVLMQETNFPFEIVIGEDESDDGTREICKEYAEEYPERIRLLLHRRENNISIHGRPTGKFQQTYSRFKCRGKYIALCQGDDYWTDPKKLQRQKEILEKNNKYSVSYHLSINKINKKDKIEGNIQNTHKPGKIITWPRTSTMMYKNEINKYPKSYFEVVNTDSFLKSILEVMGRKKRIDILRPSVRVIQPSGMWGAVNKSRKLEERLESRFEIYKYVSNSSQKSDRHKNRLVSDIIGVLKICIIWSKKSPKIWSTKKVIKKSYRNGVFTGLIGAALKKTLSKICPVIN